MLWNSGILISKPGFLRRKHVKQTLRNCRLPIDKLIKRQDRILLSCVFNLYSDKRSVLLRL